VKRLALALTFLTANAALAQPAPPPPQGELETVYTEAQREKDLSAARWVVEDILRPSFSLDGQYARWKQPVCPHVYGLKPVAAWQIEHRIREVAAMVGAPVDREDPCIPNIGIIFTEDPQASLMSVADKAPLLIEGGNQKLTVKYPVQAWYATFIAGGASGKLIDIPWEMVTPPLDGPPFVRTISSGTRLNTGFTAEMAAATVLVDSKAVTGMNVGELGDYLALMTLAQSGQYGDCMEAASITNLMLQKCPAENRPHSLSHVDLALLDALYAVPDEPEALQKQRVVGTIRRELEKDFAKN
jgi:hypothetical protein